MKYANTAPHAGGASACARCIIFFTCTAEVRIDAHEARACNRRALGSLDVHPDESDRDRWIATNRSKRSLYVQQPSFSTTNVLELRPGLSCALVEGSRIALSPCSGWVNVSVR